MCIRDEHKYQAVVDNHKNISTGQFTGATVFVLVMIAIFGGWTTCENQIEVILACIASFVSIIFFSFATVAWYAKTQVTEKCGRAIEGKTLKSKNSDNKQSGECEEQERECCLFIMRESNKGQFLKGFSLKHFFSKVNPWLAISAALIWIAVHRCLSILRLAPSLQ